MEPVQKRAARPPRDAPRRGAVGAGSGAHARTLAFLFVAGAVASAWYGCSIYDTSLLTSVPVEGGADDAGDAPLPFADAADGGDADPCAHFGPPPRPARDDGNDDREIVTALRSLDIGIRVDGGAPPSLGFDLDHVCTCPGPESCVVRVPGAQHCDDDAGRDNSGGDLLQKFAALSSGVFSQQAINDRINAGDYGLVIRVRHYNGKLNDTKVEVSAFVSNGTTTVDGGAPIPPRWDGTDSWTLDPSSVLGGSGDAGLIIPNYFDTEAYVAGGVLVAKVDFPLTLGGGSGNGILTLELTGSFFTAALTPEGSSFRIDDGVLAGRWATKKLLGALAALHDPTNQSRYLCPGSTTYANVKSLICKAADITADPRQSDPSARCDALSLGFGFTAFPAKIGPVESRGIASATCPDAAPDECN